ncbi:MAG: dihydropteroate synthase [Myxococcales bacterium]|nr:dihydropteroate synthase [Myxococcales bacterium]
MKTTHRFGLDNLGQRTLVMGVLNVTPDSFSDGGRHAVLDAAVDRAHQLREEGADIIDIGGESTRPGAIAVPVEEELRRVLPVFEALQAAGLRGLSVDTTKAVVARRAVELGAEVINDVSACSFDPEMVTVAKETGTHLVLGHTLGSPLTMQTGPIEYPSGVTKTVRTALADAVDRTVSGGVSLGKILVDPGFGFGKTVEHNCQLLRELSEFRRLGVPVVVGTSRKSFLGAVTGRKVEDRIYATASSVALSVAGGADVVRVHDVRAMADVVRVADAVVRNMIPAPTERTEFT